MKNHTQDFSTFSMNESRSQGILFLLLDEGDVVDVFSHESQAIRAHERLVAKKYANQAEQRLIARGLTDDEWSDTYHEEIEAIADEEGSITMDETTTAGLVRTYGPEEALLIVSSAKGLDPDAKEAVMAAVKLASSRSMEESMGANYVLKGGSRPYDPPKDYLMMLDGSQFRGHMGRTYDVSDFRGIRQRGIDFSGADFRGINMDGAFFRFCSFDGCDMTGASCKGTTFVGCSFRGTEGTSSLDQAVLRDCTFTDMDADKRMKNIKTFESFTEGQDEGKDLWAVISASTMTMYGLYGSMAKAEMAKREFEDQFLMTTYKDNVKDGSTDLSFEDWKKASPDDVEDVENDLYVEKVERSEEKPDAYWFMLTLATPMDKPLPFQKKKDVIMALMNDAGLDPFVPSEYYDAMFNINDLDEIHSAMEWIEEGPLKSRLRRMIRSKQAFGM